MNFREDIDIKTTRKPYSLAFINQFEKNKNKNQRAKFEESTCNKMMIRLKTRDSPVRTIALTSFRLVASANFSFNP